MTLLPAPPAVLTVTIPTPESGDAVRRALRAAIEGGAPTLGIVENMVGDQFPGDAADALAAEFVIPYWPHPISSTGCRLSDLGRVYEVSLH